MLRNANLKVARGERIFSDKKNKNRSKIGRDHCCAIRLLRQRHKNFTADFQRDRKYFIALSNKVHQPDKMKQSVLLFHKERSNFINLSEKYCGYKHHCHFFSIYIIFFPYYKYTLPKRHVCMIFCTPGAQMANAKLLKPDRIIQQLESTVMDFPGGAPCKTNEADSFQKNKQNR